MKTYVCQAVVKGILVEDKITASSVNQARYRYCCKHGFSLYDFKTIGTVLTNEQLKFEI